MQELSIAQNQLTMSSRDLWVAINIARESMCESKVRYNDFYARMTDELDDEDYETFVVQNSNKTTTTVARLDKEQCILVSMRESKSVRRIIKDRLKALGKPAIPQNLGDALRLAADQADQIALMKPSYDFAEKIKASDHTYSLTEAGKKIKQRPRKFIDWLTENGFINAKNKPYQQYINQGLFEVSTGIRNEHEYTQTRVTLKGCAYFSDKLKGVKL